MTQPARLPKGTRRSIRRYAIQAQLAWARAAGFLNREGHGADSLYYGPDGEALLPLGGRQAASKEFGA